MNKIYKKMGIDPRNKITGKDVCNYVCAVIKNKNPSSTITPEQIWNCSPTGELYPVFELFDAALESEGWKKTIDPKTGDITWIEPRGI